MSTMTGPDGHGLRHLDFSDPPYGMDPGDYEAILRGLAREAPDLETLTAGLVMSLGSDLIEEHHADPHAARSAVTRLAEKLWNERDPAEVR